MSIYNRSYMRARPTDFHQREWALKGILIVLVVIFLLQNIFRHWMGSNFLELNFALNIYRLSQGWIHTLVTYGFLHSTQGALPWHLVFNGLMLYWFGKEIEGRIGSERFLECFLFCILTGGIIWSCVHFLTQQSMTVLGASAGVFGILYLFCRYRWDTALSFLFIPVQFTGKQLFWIILGFQAFFFLFAEVPGSGGSATANSAHLGGMLGAYIYERRLLTLPTLISLFRRLKTDAEVRPPAWEKRAEAVKSKTGPRYSVNVTERPVLKQEVDRILDKINAKGFGALTPEEKKTLDEAKDLL